MVVIVVVKLADRVSWRTVLWPLKKAAQKVEEEAKKV